jgi:hypothetical protein
LKDAGCRYPEHLHIIIGYTAPKKRCFPDVFRIEDAFHAEPVREEFDSLEEAVGELRRREALPFEEPPVKPPCKNWQTCQRIYEVIEYDASSEPWEELRRIPYLEISAEGSEWLVED